jgi:hypothetical protein
MKRNGSGTSRNGRIVNALVIAVPLLVAAAKLLAGVPAIDVAELLGSALSTTLAHALAALSLMRTILGARRSSAAGDWLVRRVLGERVAARLRAAPAVSDVIVDTYHELRARGCRSSRRLGTPR